MNEKLTIGDIIELSDVKLVIELDDADRDPEGIFHSFILTDEVERGILSILKKIEEGKGCGAFIKGNFGSGKSHFLSFLYLLLKNKDHSILKDFERCRSSTMNLIKVSLVRYPASLSLEKIILQCLDYRGDVPDREGVFKRLLNGPSVIIMDELSEFLRSKDTPPHFYEDVRFLQFLGEFSMRHPLWVIASLQEWIEETGHISSSIFNRIKDRYPLRINLTSSHIEDIIDQRLIIKKEGSTETIKGVFDDLRRFYPSLDLRFERFRKTYPLHPFTSRFLSGLTRVFSQHRGVIQFVQSEVRKRLDDPPHALITPEAIFDHFEDRIREVPEFSALARVAYDYYKNNLDRVFSNTLQRSVAMDVIKILILSEISPLEKRKSAKDIAEILLKRISTVTDRINYDYIKNGILEPLVAHQMYIIKEGETYFIDVSAEEGIKIKGKIKSIRERFSDREYLFLEIANLLSLPYLPLRDIKDGRRYRFNWQNSMRECMVVLLNKMDKDDVERFGEAIKRRFDGYLVILSPFSDLHRYGPFESHLFTSSHLLSLVLLWQPRRLTDEETIFIEEYIAKNMLLGEFPSLNEELKREEPLFRDTITKAYFEGRVLSIGGGDGINIKDIGYLPMERLLTHLFDHLLREVYPEHERIMPRVDLYTSHHIEGLFNHIIRQGRLTIEDAEKKGLIPFIKGILEPLGLVAKRGSTYTISITPDNELISFILDLLAAEHDIYNIRMALRRSRWGLADEQIDLLLSSLIVSGYLVPYNRQGVSELKEISQLSSGGITSLRPGRGIEPELLSAIPRGRFIWGDIESPPTPATQKMIWKEASQFIRRYRKIMDELQTMINRYKEYSIFKLMRIDMPIINRMAIFVHSVGLNLSPQEGIERVLLFLKEHEEIAEEVSYIERLYRFFDEEFQLLNKYFLYLTHPSLKVRDDLGVLRDGLLSKIKGFLKDLGDLEGVRSGWGEFYDAFSSAYKDAHERYYDSLIFSLRGEVEASQAARTLKRIAHIVSSITFENEWWDIKKMLDELPNRCSADLNHELFLNPSCRCGFQIGMEPPTNETDLLALCEEGVRNFIGILQSPENMEKIDSTITGLNLSGKKELSERLLKVIHINPSKTGINVLTSLLDEAVLGEIENALKGRWKVKEVFVEELLNMIRGRRFRYDELKRTIMEWLGGDEDSIIHVRSQAAGDDLIREDLELYGPEGKKAYMGLLNSHIPIYMIPPSQSIEYGLTDAPVDGIEDEMKAVFDGIDLRGFETGQLLDFLRSERFAYMKKRLRDEVFVRLWSSDLPIETETKDEIMEDIVKAINLVKRAERFRGVQVFTEVLAPFSLVVDRLLYKNINDRFIDHELLERLSITRDSFFREFENRSDRYEGTIGISELKEGLSDVIVIMDGLRYDLWLILKGIMMEEGWKTKEMVLRIDTPSTTSNFRELLGIEDEAGVINGKNYCLLKVAERDIGKRNLRRFLKDGADIKLLQFNFIDVRVHGTTVDLCPLYNIIKDEFITGILPILKEVGSFKLVSDHGFTDTKALKDRYSHGGKSVWEVILPFAEIRL